MQLILHTGTTVELNEKMSLNGDNLEKDTLDVQFAVANGDIANGDIANKDNGPDDSDTKLDQVKEDPVTNTEHFKSDSITSKANIESPHERDNEFNKAADIVNGKDESTSNESVEETSINNDCTNVGETEINEGNIIVDARESEPVDEEQEDGVSDRAVTQLNHDNNTDIRNEINNIETELKNDNLPTGLTADETECFTVQKEDAVSINTDTKLNNKVQLNDEPGTVDSPADASTEKEPNLETIDNHDVDDVENEINSKNASSNINIDENGMNPSNEDANPNINVDHGNSDPSKILDGEVNPVSCIEENDNASVPTEIIKSEVQIEDVENISEIENTINREEGIIIVTSNMEVNEENVSNSETDDQLNQPEANISVSTENVKMETEEIDTSDGNLDLNTETDDQSNQPEANILVSTENVKMETEKINTSDGNTDLNTETDDQSNQPEANISVSTENVKMETEETDTSDGNIDLIDLNTNKESENIVECLRKELEEEHRMFDIEEEKNAKADKDDTARKPDVMDVEVKLEDNLEASELILSDASEDPKNILTVNCNLNEPIVDQNESVNLIQENSDDVVFNLDDDKEQENETKTKKPKQSESTEIILDENKPASGSGDDKTITDSALPKRSDEIIDLDENGSKSTVDVVSGRENIPEKTADAPKILPILKLSNTLDILSDDEDEPKETNVESKCINIEDDDDVMLIDEDTEGNETKTEPVKETEKENREDLKPKSPVVDTVLNNESVKGENEPTTETEVSVPEKEVIESTPIPEVSEKVKELSPEKENTKQLLHEKFLKACKKNLSEMTRDELEEFCILKIVESVIDRSGLSEVKAKLKTLSQNIDEYNKKTKMLTKQNRDLQVVLKSVQEDQKKGVDNIVPLKITRSVGMQVLMTDKVVQRRKGIGLPGQAPANKQIRNPVVQGPRPQKPQAPQIPVPRLVPANNPTLKSPNAPQPVTAKVGSPLPNGIIKNPNPVQKGEKRTHNRIQSVTVDLTDDEPPAKVVNRTPVPVVPPVRLVPSQNLLAPPRPATVNSPRKVYIPISGPQGQNVRPGQTIMLKTVPNPGPRQRCPPPHMVRMPQTMRMPRPQGMRHPAPLPDCMKQYQPPNWKALPPAPDLKLAKVENGIVISWKIEGYQDDSYEEIASYQLYAYQETASPPNTALWKKIGDVKALPLPMACTLTQFMAGYKYYFAVRAIDIRSRTGPFSLPGSILLLNKM